MNNRIFYVQVMRFTRSNALFYPSKEYSGGRTWLLFPEYKLAIECASPVLISWDGRVEKHCDIYIHSSLLHGKMYNAILTLRERLNWIIVVK